MQLYSTIFRKTLLQNVFYKVGIVKLQAGSGQTQLLFQQLISSDDAFFQFGDVVDKNPLTLCYAKFIICAFTAPASSVFF